MNDPTNYRHLRQSGLDRIRQLAAASWTDYNAADPGITLLEQLCYALTDLGYRIEFDVADLLAAGGDAAYRLLYTPRQVLTSRAVTFPDFRRLLLDHAAVRNVEVSLAREPRPLLFYAPFSEELLLREGRDELLPEDVYRQVRLRGLLEVDVQGENGADPASLHTWLERKLQQNRPLCGDFDQVAVQEEEVIKIQLHVELGATKDAEGLVARIWRILDRYISPSLHFQPLPDLRGGEPVEQIFEGPALASGFLLQDQLRRFQKRREIRRSDLIRELMTLTPEIKAIRMLNIARAGESFSAALDWVMPLDAQKSAVFDRNQSKVEFFTDNLSVPIDCEVAENKYQEQQQQERPETLTPRELDIIPERGVDREVAHYTSIRLHLPEVYGVTPRGLPETASVARQAQARQLSTYLLFFEQILADYFAQLGELPRLLSVDRDETDQQSYFTQALDDLPAVERIYRNPAPERLQNIRAIFQDQDRGRNNRLLDHFLARFSEQFFDNIIDPGVPNNNAFLRPASAKRAFLKEYPALSAGRGTTYDYTGTYWNTDNVSGAEKRIARLLGLRSYRRRNLAEYKLEGFYLLEHILLRPVGGDHFQEDALMGCLRTEDPYSLQVSYVFHAISRFAQEKKQCFIERLLRAETPAHIRIQTYWLNTGQMELFEKAYESFLKTLKQLKTTTLPDDHQYGFRVARDQLLDLLYIFHPNHPTEPNNTGIPFPLRDLPLPARAPKYQANISQNGEGDWLVDIQIYYPQVGVTYRLCDRNRQPVTGSAPVTVSGTTDISFDDQEGKPYVLISTPPLDQDKTYWIRAEKTLYVPTEKTLRYVFLTRPVRIRVGIAPVEVTAIPPEIDYGTQVQIELADIQANVDYRLYADIDGDGTFALISEADPPFNGPENGTIIVPTNVAGGLTEDLLIVVRGSRDGFTTAADVGSTAVRVRANPVLPINVGTPVIAFGNTSAIGVSGLDAANPTQASVQYSLYYRPISDPEFAHHQASSPPDAEVEVLDNGGGTEVKVRRPDSPLTVNLAPVDYVASPLSPIPYQFVETLSPAVDGETLNFDTGGLAMTEDTLFLVVASKPGHDQLVILGNDGMAAIGVVLTRPDPSPTFLVDPDPVPAGNKGRIEVDGAQPGVKYYLQFKNGVKQPFNFRHDESAPSPRRDGVGFSKVGVDIVVGEVSPLPLVLETRNPLTATTTLRLVAEKVQTGITLILADVTFEVS